MVANSARKQRNVTAIEAGEFRVALHSPVRVPLGSRSGGSYPLPGGGRLKLVSLGGSSSSKQRASSGTLKISAVPACCLASSSPPLQEQELLASPVYLIELTSPRSSQRPRLTLTLPLLRRPLPTLPPIQRLRLANRPTDQVGEGDSDSWTTVETAEDDNKSITCVVNSSGIYVAILSPLWETFQVSPNGGLLNLKLDPIVSVRIPKRGCLEALDCCFSIIPFSDERLSLARRAHPSQTMDIRCLSPVYNFDYPGGEFKRPITLKLPLPHWLLTAGDSAERPAAAASLAADSSSVTIFYQPRTGLTAAWCILDPGSTLKLTKNSISFEARHLTRYCFASVDPAKAQRASLAMPLLCSLNNAIEGEILLFAKLEDQLWRLCVDCAPRNEIVDRISDRVQAKGWQFLQSLQLQQQLQQQQQQSSSSGSSFRRRPNPRRQAENSSDNRRGTVRLRNGAIFIVRLGENSDFGLCQEDSTTDEANSAVAQHSQQMLVQYHQLLSDAPAVFRLVPTERCRTVASDFFDYLMQQQQEAEDSESKAADAAPAKETLVFKSQISILDESGDLVSDHEISLGFDSVKTYLGLRPPTPPPPPTPTPPPSPPPPTQRGVSAAAAGTTAASGSKRIPTLPRLRLRVNELDPAQARIESFQRLTAPRRNLPAPITTRESKALSVRSLQTLSEHVRQGLTLAVHLSLPENAITGIGFDVMSAGGGSLSSVTYKILTHWKRSVPLPDRAGMAQRLADALARMGRSDLARVVIECDATNCELTPELLLS